MLKHFFKSLLLFILIQSCSQRRMDFVSFLDEEKPYRWVGDISEDPTFDDPDFQLCNGEENVAQYFHSGKSLDIDGEQTAIYKAFDEQYTPVDSDQSGLIRIRFVVNCQGISGRFRLTASDENYQEITFEPAITDQLLKITKSLEGWGIQENDYGTLDYYQYLVFVMDKGRIKEILP